MAPAPLRVLQLLAFSAAAARGLAEDGWRGPRGQTLDPLLDADASILRLSRGHLVAAARHSNFSLDVGEIAEGIEHLLPVVGVLASFVSKPLRKDALNLRTAAAGGDGDLASLVSRELHERESDDRPIAASAYWSFLFLGFFETIVDGVLAAPDAFDAAAAADARADAAIRDSAKVAYERHYAPQHNVVVRAVARKVLNFIPGRERIFRAFGRPGADRARWHGELRAELRSFLGAVRPCLQRLEDTFRGHPLPRL